MSDIARVLSVVIGVGVLNGGDDQFVPLPSEHMEILRPLAEYIKAKIKPKRGETAFANGVRELHQGQFSPRSLVLIMHHAFEKSDWIELGTLMTESVDILGPMMCIADVAKEATARVLLKKI